MFQRIFSLVAVSVLVSGLGCGGDEETQGFNEMFLHTDTVSSSIFDQSLLPVVGDFEVVVISRGVSSGFVRLNGEDLMRSNDFHNDSFEKTLSVGLLDQNLLEVELRGSPGDQLCVRVYEVDGDDQSERGIYERCVDREAGPPNQVSVIIDATEEESCGCNP